MHISGRLPGFLLFPPEKGTVPLPSDMFRLSSNTAPLYFLSEENGIICSGVIDVLVGKAFTQGINRCILIFKNVHEISHHVLDFMKILQNCRFVCDFCTDPLPFANRYLDSDVSAFSGCYFLRQDYFWSILAFCLALHLSSVRFLRRLSLHGFHTPYTHGSFSDCSGLVQTECINSCQSLNTV